jgi:hypothetical protein
MKAYFKPKNRQHLPDLDVLADEAAGFGRESGSS